jgi:hypothetical protein
VKDADGKVAGRILSVSAEITGEECLVREFHLGPAALLERLGMSVSGLAGLPLHREPLRVGWEDMDLSDPQRPRLRAPLDEVKRRSR